MDHINLSRRGSLMVAIGALLIATYSIFMLLKEDGISINLYNNQSSSWRPFPAIYNFGDSNSDTGSVSAVFGQFPPPNGMTYFHKPSGRVSDGRLIIDFIAEKLGLPFLSAYADSIGTNFRHGANFAASGSTIQPADALMLNRTFNPLTLSIQLSQFEQFKRRSSDLYLEVLVERGQLKFILEFHVDPFRSEKRTEVRDRLPRPEDYAKALYRFDIGQNDLNGGIISMEEEEVIKYIPAIINQLSSTVEKLYEGGARNFWIHNTGPIGCLPLLIQMYPPAPENVDETGCVKSYNRVAQEFNKQLKDRVSTLGIQLQESSFVYFDIYSLKYSLISEANKNGFTDPFGICFRDDGNVSKACANPSEYISWDGIHYTDAANKWVAKRLQYAFVTTPTTPLPTLQADF